MSVHKLDLDRLRRTTADELFEQLRGEIISMQRPPGSRLSEADVAKAYDVSRQPVREAFIRLANQNLVDVRPQRATVVKRISLQEIRESRFVRMAVEMEIIRRACEAGPGALMQQFEEVLEAQRDAVDTKDKDRFNAKDYEFHQLICETAKCEFAYRYIAENKLPVDRLCMLSLSDGQELTDVYQDHVEMFDRLRAQDEAGLIDITKRHLSRLDPTVAMAQETHPDFFDE